MLQTQTAGFSTFNGCRCLALTTFRKDGQPVMTPVWFAQEDDKLYLLLPADSEVVQRIHENAQVEVAPQDESGKPSGAPVEAMAVVLDGSRAERAGHILNQQASLRRRLYHLLLNVRLSGCVNVEITPM